MNGCHIKPEQFFNLIFGYNAIYKEFSSDTNPGAGTILKTLSAVPAGEIWVVQEVFAYNDARGARMLLRIKDSSTRYELQDATSSGAGVRVLWTGQVAISEAELIEVAFLATIAGDDLYWGARGYKVKISQ